MIYSVKTGSGNTQFHLSIDLYVVLDIFKLFRYLFFSLCKMKEAYYTDLRSEVLGENTVILYYICK